VHRVDVAGHPLEAGVAPRETIVVGVRVGAHSHDGGVVPHEVRVEDMVIRRTAGVLDSRLTAPAGLSIVASGLPTQGVIALVVDRERDVVAIVDADATSTAQ
jgi:hypothetical protein